MTLRGIQAIQDSDLPTLGQLMNICQGMLNGLQVSTPELEKLCGIALQSTGMALGVMGEMIWKQKVTRLLPGDMVVMYTDGVTGAQDPHGQFYGEQRLLQVIRRCNCSAQETLEIILEDVDHFTGSTPQSDDITLLVVRRTQ